MVALVEMYADESDSGGYLTVAGYVFTKDKAEQLNKAWMPVLASKGLPYFRMADCAHGNNHFRGLKKSERIEIQKSLFSVLKDFMGCGFSVTFDLAYQNLLPSSIGLNIKRVTPYSLCCYWLLHNASGWTKENYHDAKISYFFEASSQHQSQANNILSALYTDAFQRDHFRMASFAFVDKQYSGTIQCGDILAWQWSKNNKDRMEGRVKPRADLMSLLEKPHFTTNFDQGRIIDFLNLLKKHNGPPSMTT